MTFIPASPQPHPHPLSTDLYPVNTATLVALLCPSFVGHYLAQSFLATLGATQSFLCMGACVCVCMCVYVCKYVHAGLGVPFVPGPVIIGFNLEATVSANAAVDSPGISPVTVSGLSFPGDGASLSFDDSPVFPLSVILRSCPVMCELALCCVNYFSCCPRVLSVFLKLSLSVLVTPPQWGGAPHNCR